MSKKIAIHWFRQDLRLEDNPSLVEAASKGQLLPIYILDDKNAQEHKMGAASRLWLHHSLSKLNEQLEGKLQLFEGDAFSIIKALVESLPLAQLSWNRCYEPWRIDRDTKIKSFLEKQGIAVKSHKASLLWEPWQVLKNDQSPYQVFTPFYKRACLFEELIPPALKKPPNFNFAKVKASGALKSVEALKLLPTLAWGKKLISHWQVGEEAAKKALKTFLNKGVEKYKEGRDFPQPFEELCYVSRLSPHLHFGEIAPQRVWHEAKKGKEGVGLSCFLSELGWREFSYYLLYHFPHIPKENLNKKFDAFDWGKNKKRLECWQQGMTGYPIVDAGMRELWQTGYIHNRVRMIVGSFLVKNLLIDWREGERWFWDCLVDADLASNSASWQWVAGCGADAAPYFRIFNPVTQGEKFDTEGQYTRHYVPELKNLPNKYLFCPWQAPEEVLRAAGIELGKDYPLPIVDLAASRQAALDAYQRIR